MWFSISESKFPIIRGILLTKYYLYGMCWDLKILPVWQYICQVIVLFLSCGFLEQHLAKNIFVFQIKKNLQKA